MDKKNWGRQDTWAFECSAAHFPSGEDEGQGGDDEKTETEPVCERACACAVLL